jgi:hypothetical protein
MCGAIIRYGTQQKKAGCGMFFTSTVSILFKALLFIGILIHSFRANAQIEQTTRFELFLSPADPGNLEVLAAGTHGLILNRRLSFPTEDRIELIKLDTAFKEEWRGYLSIEPRLNFISKRIVGNKLFLLFRDRDQPKKNFHMYTITIGNGTFVKNEIRNMIPFAPMEFQITDNAAIIGGYFNTVPVVIYHSLHDHKTKVLPGLLNESGELTQVKTYPDNSFDVLIRAKDNNGTKTIWIKNYNAEGNLIRNLPLTTEDDKHLIFARSLKMDSEHQIVAGVYGKKFSTYSKGIFISRIDPTGYQEIQYYNYGDLHNFFKYMKAKREQRVQDRIQRRKIRGKKIRFNYRFMVHEIVPHNDQFIMLGEAFYPEYTTVDRIHGGSFFRPSYYSNSIIREGRVFDGYRYTHAVVIGFNEHGKVIWDNSFEINDVKTFTLEQFVKLEIENDHITLLYLYDNALRTKVIQGNEVIEGKNIAPLKKGTERPVSPREKITTEKLDYWYPNTFYASGITERYSSTGGLQRVFFINKITGTLSGSRMAEQKDIPR